MSTLQCPTTEHVRQSLRYENGVLFWRIRPLHHFPDARTWKSWNSRHAGKLAGNRNKGYGRWKVCLDNTLFFRSRLIWLLFNPTVPEILDHKDRNHQDDRIENLRPANISQSNANQKKSRNNTSGFKGVSRGRRGKNWRAKIQNKILGTFNTAEEAHAAYVQAAKEVYGAFAFGG